MGKEYRSVISQEEIDGLPAADFNGRIVIVDRTGRSMSDAVRYLKKQKVLGFDTETKPVFQPGEKRHDVALLQLSGGDRAYLFRICKTGLDSRVAGLLSNDNIIKVGAAVKDDINGLRRLRWFNPKSFVDLQTVVRGYGIENVSVKKMAAIVLGVRVSKTQRLTNWEASSLTDAQAKYAAIDAWVCREMYLSLNENEIKDVAV